MSEPLILAISQALNSSQVPCVLWGHFLLNVHGVPSMISSIDFIIRDDCLHVSEKVLRQIENLVPCPNQNSCETISLDRPTPPPALHMHIKDIEDVTVGLYLQSDTIWFLPALESSLLSARNVELPSPYVLASDQTVLPPWRPARGSGFFKSNRYPVIVLKSHMLLEAFMRLYVRDLNKRIGLFALAMVGYMMMYVEEDGFLDAQLLPEPLRTSYENLKKGRKPVRQWSKELVEALGTSGQGF